MPAYYFLTQPSAEDKLLAPNENIVDFRAEGISTGLPFVRSRRTIENIGEFYPNEYIGFQDAWNNSVYFYWRTNPQGVNEVLATPAVPNAADILASCESFVTKFNTSKLTRHTASIDYAFNTALGIITAYIIIEPNFDGAGGVLSTLGTFPIDGGPNSVYDVTFLAGSVPYYPLEVQKPVTIGRVYTNDENVVGREFPSQLDKADKVLVGEIAKPYLSGSTLQFNPISLMRHIQYVEKPQYNTVFEQATQLKRYWVEFITKGTLGNTTDTLSDPLDQTDIYWSLNAAQDIICGYDLTGFYYQSTGPCAEQYRRVLSNAPTSRVKKQPVLWSKNPVMRNESEFLSWISEDAGSEISIVCTVRFESGSTTTLTKLLVDDNNDPILSTIGVLTCDVSPDFIGFNSLVLLSEVADWELYIAYNTVQYTETRRYRKVENCLNNRVQILFLNDLGGWDTYYFIGDNDNKDERKFVDFDRTIDNNYSCDDIVNGIKSVDYTRGYKLNSGQLTAQEFNWLEELCKSPEIYIIDNLGGFNHYIITSTNRQTDSIKDLYTLNIEVKRTVAQNSLSI